MMTEDQKKKTDTTVGAASTTGTVGSDDTGHPVACLVSDILACYASVSNLPTLDPSPQVDALFGQLVHLCRQTPTDATTARVCVPSHPGEPSLPEYCKNPEGSLC